MAKEPSKSEMVKYGLRAGEEGIQGGKKTKYKANTK